MEAIPIIGGTGALGFGLALRLAAAGRSVAIGSRDAGRAEEAAAKIEGATGLENAAAARLGPIVFLTVPFRAQSENLTNLKEALEPGQILVDATVPLAAAVSGKATRLLGVPQGSAAQQAQEMVPDGVTVVSALHTVSASALADPEQQLDEDVLVCGDDRDAKRQVAELIALIDGLRPVDAGKLEVSRLVEGLTPMLISVNIRHKTHAGVKLTGLPGELWEVALLSGGTGGAKLARGLLDVADRLTVIANTGDDVEMYGVHVSPDPDLVTYWLADAIDERGYGIRGDTWEVMDALEAAGHETWFRLGDRDLAMCLMRTDLMARGGTQTEAHAAVVKGMGVGAQVLPASDDPIRTWITVDGRQMPFQRFMILEGGKGPIEQVGFLGAADALPAKEAASALEQADCVVIGPSNPIASIGPMLAIPKLREAVASSAAPVVAVSPFVGGEVLKGPTLEFCRWGGVEPSAEGVARHYSGLIDGMVADEHVGDLPCLVTDTLLDTAEDRARIARETLEFAASLRGA